MKGLPSAGNAAYSDICEYSEQRMGNLQWKGFPQIRRHSRINQSFLKNHIDWLLIHAICLRPFAMI